jgi:hypothetical protein
MTMFESRVLLFYLDVSALAVIRRRVSDGAFSKRSAKAQYHATKHTNKRHHNHATFAQRMDRSHGRRAIRLTLAFIQQLQQPPLRR